MPTAQDKEFMAKLKDLAVEYGRWIAFYEADYADVGEVGLHLTKGHIPTVQALADDFEATIDVGSVTDARTPSDRFMIDLLEDVCCAQVDYMEFLETYSYTGRNADLVQTINIVKRVEGELREFDTAIEWIRDGEDRW